MDVSFTLNEIDFKWNGRKAAANLRKHEISFETAAEVFFDPFVHVLDAGTVESEQREAGPRVGICSTLFMLRTMM